MYVSENNKYSNLVNKMFGIFKEKSVYYQYLHI